MKKHEAPPHTPDQQAEFDEEVRYWLEDAQSELIQGR
jgi:hypothetical protein